MLQFFNFVPQGLWLVTLVRKLKYSARASRQRSVNSSLDQSVWFLNLPYSVGLSSRRDKSYSGSLKAKKKDSCKQSWVLCCIKIYFFVFTNIQELIFCRKSGEYRHGLNARIVFGRGLSCVIVTVNATLKLIALSEKHFVPAACCC